MRTLVATLLLVSAAGCATYEPAPADYKGPIARLSDTGAREDGSKARFFAVLEIDGQIVRNALGESRSASYGQGFALTSRYTTRNVPIRPMKLKLIGTHQTGAPIHEIASRMAGTFFRVDGVVEFTPQEGRQYEVVGELAKERSCVWVVDVDTKQSATEKICAPK